jgi:hypothetical protein
MPLSIRGTRTCGRWGRLKAGVHGGGRIGVQGAMCFRRWRCSRIVRRRASWKRSVVAKEDGEEKGEGDEKKVVEKKTERENRLERQFEKKGSKKRARGEDSDDE